VNAWLEALGSSAGHPRGRLIIACRRQRRGAIAAEYLGAKVRCQGAPPPRFGPPSAPCRDGTRRVAPPECRAACPIDAATVVIVVDAGWFLDGGSRNQRNQSRERFPPFRFPWSRRRHGGRGMLAMGAGAPGESGNRWEGLSLACGSASLVAETRFFYSPRQPQLLRAGAASGGMAPSLRLGEWNRWTEGCSRWVGRSRPERDCFGCA
jgi:hypothetical protein